MIYSYISCIKALSISFKEGFCEDFWYKFLHWEHHEKYFVLCQPAQLKSSFIHDWLHICRYSCRMTCPVFCSVRLSADSSIQSKYENANITTLKFRLLYGLGEIRQSFLCVDVKCKITLWVVVQSLNPGLALNILATILPTEIYLHARSNVCIFTVWKRQGLLCHHLTSSLF